jgi:hypothetical protein
MKLPSKVDVSRGRLFAGFRGPTLDNGRAAILSVALDALFGDKPADPRRFHLPLGNGQSQIVCLLTDLARIVGKKGKRKSEALLPLDPGLSGFACCMFDGEKEGAPMAVVIPGP